MAAAAASGATTFGDVGELRVKESDRLAATARLVRSLGASASIDGDDLVIEGPDPHRDSAGSSMTPRATTAWRWQPRSPQQSGSGAVVDGFAGVATSYPGFLSDLASLR